ncbi:V-type ATP synthase subunit I [Clostridium amazonitimonense]|uniref:V-type ATP synthase subunit I n=1 Tax=Clostridium amazonitimonense TaxID=1499689 RepID=UPI0005099F35|nr:V-type ATP synthase subunit I [Clostridium amazonitimonense]
MAIVKMNKFTLLAFESQKQQLLEELQRFEGVQFINLQDEIVLEKHEELKDLKKDNLGEEFDSYEDALSKIKFSLEFLNPYMEKEPAVKAFLNGKKSLDYRELDEKMKANHWKDIYETLKKKEERLNTLSNERTKIDTEITTLDLWVNFDAPFKDLKNLKYVSPFIGNLAMQYEEDLLKDFNESIKEGYIEVINKDSQDMYIYALVPKEDQDKAREVLKNYGFNSFALIYDESPKDLIKDFMEKVTNINKEEDIIHSELKGLKEDYEELQIAYEYYNNNAIKLKASQNFLKTDKVVTICGWNTVDSNENLKSVISNAIGEDHYLSFNEVSDEDLEEVPIKLKNNKFAESFENIVEMYSLPLYSEIDPTPILSIFYFIFFGMMLSDAGYGLIMVVASILGLKFAKDKDKKKTFKFFLLAGISTVAWGAIYGGWFGDLLSEYLGIKVPYLLDPPTSIIEIFTLSLAFGIIHIFVGLGIKAYMLIRDHKIKDAIYDVFTWYITLIGSLLLILGKGGSAGKWMLILGLVALLLTQGRSAPTLGGKIGGGVYGVYGITGYLGDVVSYSRLLALGLATGFIANALNLIVSLFPKPFIYVLAPILFIFLHLFNLVINALGSYVHAARLQYLEFFGKFYEGGGKKFTPYKLSEEYIKITK